MSTDIKLSKVRLSKTIQSGESLGKTLGNLIGDLGKKSVIRGCCFFGYRFFV